MLVLAILLFSLLAGVSGILLLRLLTAQRNIRRSIWTALGNGPFSRQLFRLIVRGMDKSLLLQAREGGLADVKVRLLEHFDSYRSVGELLMFQLNAIQRSGFDDRLNAIKTLYQLQDALRLLPVDVEECLHELMSRLKSTEFAGKPIAHVKTVAPGVLLDQRTMFPLDFGSQVKQPLGVIVFAQDGKVLSKAKVFCAS